MQTPVVDYIFDQLEENSLFFRGTDNELNISISASDYLDLKRLAKEMFKKSIIDAFELLRAGSGEQYYNETYGSKGSDEHIVDTNEMIDQVPDVRKMVEISDEEIEELADEFSLKYYTKGDGYEVSAFVTGMKMYREQLKKKQ